jgi:polyhydroxybutyrate depolymerase
MQPLRWTSAALIFRPAAGVFVALLASACGPDRTERNYGRAESSVTSGPSASQASMDGGSVSTAKSAELPDASALSTTTGEDSSVPSMTNSDEDASSGEAGSSTEPVPDAMTSASMVPSDEPTAIVPEPSLSPTPSTPLPSESAMPSSSPSASTMPSMAPTMSPPSDIKPSAGCINGASTPTISNSLVDLPTGYDGETPVPVVFAFHAAGNTNTQLKMYFAGTELREKYLLVYLNATSGNAGWNLAADRPRFDTAYDELLANACVDENRVYAMGHSLGAQFVVQLLCDDETRFRAVAPVASSVYCSSWTPVAALVIHGTADTVREGIGDADGQEDIVPYVTSNGCEMTTQPSPLDVAGCSGTIDPGCVDYVGCETPVTWCNHNDPQYSNTNHGIPCFAKSAIFDFFETH